MDEPASPFLPGSRLPTRWKDWIEAQPETGMGYWVVDVTLLDRTVVPDVAIGAGHVLEVKDQDGVPFDPNQVADVRLTHRRWTFRRNHEGP